MLKASRHGCREASFRVRTEPRLARQTERKPLETARTFYFMPPCAIE